MGPRRLSLLPFKLPPGRRAGSTLLIQRPRQVMSHTPRPSQKNGIQDRPAGSGPLLASLRCALFALRGRGAAADTALWQCDVMFDVEAQAITPKVREVGGIIRPLGARV